MSREYKDKWIKIYYKNGDVYKLHAAYVAESYAIYYGDKDGVSKDSQEWQDIYYDCYHSNSELIDWFKNNFDVIEYKQHLEFMYTLDCSDEIIDVDVI